MKINHNGNWLHVLEQKKKKCKKKKKSSAATRLIKVLNFEFFFVILSLLPCVSWYCHKKEIILFCHSHRTPGATFCEQKRTKFKTIETMRRQNKVEKIKTNVCIFLKRNRNSVPVCSYWKAEEKILFIHSKRKKEKQKKKKRTQNNIKTLDTKESASAFCFILQFFCCFCFIRSNAIQNLICKAAPCILENDVRTYSSFFS